MRVSRWQAHIREHGWERDGTLYIDTAIFDKATTGNLKSVKAFLGTTDGSGLLKNMSSVLNGLTTTDTGIVSSAIATTQAAAKAQDLQLPRPCKRRVS